MTSVEALEIRTVVPNPNNIRLDATPIRPYQANPAVLTNWLEISRPSLSLYGCPA